MVKGLEGKLCEKNLWTLDLLTWRRLRGRPHCVLMRGSGESGTDFTLVTSGRFRGNGLKLYQGRCRSEGKRVVELWNRLPKEVVTAPSLSKFKKCLVNTLK